VRPTAQHARGVAAARCLQRASLGAVLFLSACAGLKNYIPAGPPLSEAARTAWLGTPAAPTGQGPSVGVPVPPLQLFAVHYDADIVIEPVHPTWQMHELARVSVDGRSVWMAKDSDHDGVQTVTADLPDLDTWMPEVPVPRRQGEVQVEETSTPSTLDVDIAWPTSEGQRAAVSFHATPPARDERKRNTSTFNHSQQAASVVLDVRRKALGGVKATVSYDGAPHRIRRVLGLVPVKALLVQTQGGVAAASFAARPGDGVLQLERPFPGEPWPTRATESWSWSGEAGSGTLSWSAFGATHVLDFVDGGLAGARVELDALDLPGFELELSAPLPDITRPFAGVVVRNFAVRVNGQPHGHGTVTAACDGDVTTVDLVPTAPWWFAERPVRSTITAEDGAWRVESRVAGRAVAR
jgi:hypothetical protein